MKKRALRVLICIYKDEKVSYNTKGEDMKNTNPLEKAKKFASRILKLSTYIKKEKNLEEGVSLLIETGLKLGASLSFAFENEFNEYIFETLQKALELAISISFYLEVFFAIGILNDKEFSSINADCAELVAIISELLKSIHEGA